MNLWHYGNNALTLLLQFQYICLLNKKLHEPYKYIFTSTTHKLHQQYRVVVDDVFFFFKVHINYYNNDEYLCLNIFIEIF